MNRLRLLSPSLPVLLASTLAIDDAVHESHVPKVDDWQEYLYIVLRAVNHTNVESKQLQVPELDVFLGPNFVVSYFQEPIAVVDRVWEVCQKDQRWIKQGSGHLLYRLADELVSEAVTVVEQLQDELEQTEDQLFNDAGSATLERLFILKRNILQLRRIVIPQRDVLNKLARNEYAAVKNVDRIFFRDVYDEAAPQFCLGVASLQRQIWVIFIFFCHSLPQWYSHGHGAIGRQC